MQLPQGIFPNKSLFHSAHLKGTLTATLSGKKPGLDFGPNLQRVLSMTLLKKQKKEIRELEKKIHPPTPKTSQEKPKGAEKASKKQGATAGI